MSAPILVLRHVSRRYRVGVDGCSAEIAAVSDVSLRVERGECLGITGGPASGKRTLLRLAAGLLAPDTGAIWRAPTALVASEGSELGFLGVRAGLQYACAQRDLAGVEFGDDDLDAILERCALTEFAGMRVAQLTSGLRARARVAQALVWAPALLLCDDPFAPLDLAERRHFAAFLGRLREQLPLGVVVTARQRDALHGCADRLATMYAGRLLLAPHDPHSLELEVRTPAYAAGLLTRHGLGVERRGRSLRVPLARMSAEEILSACLSLGIAVRASKVVAEEAPGDLCFDPPVP